MTDLRLGKKSGSGSRRDCGVLYALSPANQMYSGIGRAIFELVRRMTDRVEYEFAMSDYFTQNLDITRTFCETHGFRLHVGRGRAESWSLDTFHDDLPAILERGAYDAVECVCWANAATNSGVLDGVGDALLAYTPHDQPLWTVPMAPEQAAHIEDVHRRILRRSDLVFCDSPDERRRLQKLAPADHCVHLNLGVDFQAFRAGPVDRKPQLLFVGDLAEPRKRFDRVLWVMERLVATRPDLRLVVVGNKSDRVGDRIPEALRPYCELRGYVSETELRRAYAESRGLFLLSDFEAFGVPIVEALASGTPVFLSEQPVARGLFGDYAGALFCPTDDMWKTLQIVEHTLVHSRAAVRSAIQERTRLQQEFDWDLLADRKWRMLSAAWYARNAYAASRAG